MSMTVEQLVQHFEPPPPGSCVFCWSCYFTDTPVAYEVWVEVDGYYLSEDETINTRLHLLCEECTTRLRAVGDDHSWKLVRVKTAREI